MQDNDSQPPSSSAGQGSLLSLRKGNAMTDGKFKCLGCGEDANAKTGDYCPQCRAFVCKECRKYVLGHDDQAKPHVPVCPLCRTLLIASDEQRGHGQA